MKKNYVKITKASLFVLAIILTVTTIKLEAQTKVEAIAKPSLPDLPHMWVPKSDGQARRDCFMLGKGATGKKCKYQLLTMRLGFNVTNLINCQADDFRNFILNLNPNLKKDGILRFYFAEYDETAGGVVPSAIKDDLTLIMVPGYDLNPQNQPGTDGEDYYNITPKGEIIKIDKSIGDGWIKYFNNNLMPELNKTIDKADKDNQANGDSSDTKSCFYRLTDFKEFLDEIDHQKSINDTITGIQINLCSNLSSGIMCDGGGPYYRDRLILQFEYTHKSEDGSTNYKVVYLEDNPSDFNNRNKQTPICNTLTGSIASSDNALLCPANCP